MVVKCKLFIPTKPGGKAECANCRRWSGKRCRGAQSESEQYEDSETFKAFDRMMRGNKGISP